MPTFTHRTLNSCVAVSVKLRARIFLLEIHEHGCVTRGKILLVELVSSRPSSDMSDIRSADTVMNDERLGLGESSEEDEMTGAYLEPGPPPTPREIDHWNYHVSLQQFAKGLQAAAKAVFPNETRSRYSCVSVLMLSWEEEDPQLPVSYEIDKLYEVFQHIYHFETEHWKIPNHNCHYRLMEKIMDFALPTDAIDHHLKIVYYAGHARLMETRSLAWTRCV